MVPYISSCEQLQKACITTRDQPYNTTLHTTQLCKPPFLTLTPGESGIVKLHSFKHLKEMNYTYNSSQFSMTHDCRTCMALRASCILCATWSMLPRFVEIIWLT